MGKKDDVYVRFIGGEETFVSGIPNRDLSRAEWDALTPELQHLASATGLYDAPPAAKGLRTKALTDNEASEAG